MGRRSAWPPTLPLLAGIAPAAFFPQPRADNPALSHAEEMTPRTEDAAR